MITKRNKSLAIMNSWLVSVVVVLGEVGVVGG